MIITFSDSRLINTFNASCSSFDMFELALLVFLPSNSLLTPIRKFATFLLPFGGRLVFSFRKISLFHSCFFFSSSSISLSAKNSFHLNALSNILHSVRICVILSLSGATQKLRPRFKSFSLASVRAIFEYL